MSNTRPMETRSSRGGYAVAIAINLALIYAVHQLWDVVPLLTGDFERLIWPMTASLAVGTIANFLYLVYDAPWFKSLSNIGVLGVSLAVTVRIYQVFPFDFSAFGFDWSQTARVFLWLVMIGTGLAMVVEAARLLSSGMRMIDPPDDRTALA